jgi:uncharacterized protein (DUF2062 family)
LSHPKLWQWSRRSVAMGLAAGLFVGLLIPVAQFVFAVAAAVCLRSNVAVAAAGTLVSNPLTVPPIYYAAYQMGAWATGTSAAEGMSLLDPLSLFEHVGSVGLPLFTGLTMTASMAALASYVLVSRAWIWRVNLRRRGVR